jgi:hypothetical protein
MLLYYKVITRLRSYTSNANGDLIFRSDIRPSSQSQQEQHGRRTTIHIGLRLRLVESCHWRGQRDESRVRGTDCLPL